MAKLQWQAEACPTNAPQHLEMAKLQWQAEACPTNAPQHLEMAKLQWQAEACPTNAPQHLEMAKLQWQAEACPTHAGRRHDLVAQAVPPARTLPRQIRGANGQSPAPVNPSAVRTTSPPAH
jgi:hypothetical protein